MATADLKLVYGGGGSFTPTFFSGALQLTSGATGTLLTITPPAGKKVRLTSLVMTTAEQQRQVFLYRLLVLRWFQG
jgi:hypothetical protein